MTLETMVEIRGYNNTWVTSGDKAKLAEDWKVTGLYRHSIAAYYNSLDEERKKLLVSFIAGDSKNLEKLCGEVMERLMALEFNLTGRDLAKLFSDTDDASPVSQWGKKWYQSHLNIFLFYDTLDPNNKGRYWKFLISNCKG